MPRPPAALNLRDRLQAGDIGAIVRMHGQLYAREHGYGLGFEAYVAEGMADFHRRFDAQRDRVWLYENAGHLIGSLCLAHRDEGAQLRYFLLHPSCRGLGLGGALMARFMAALDACGYDRAFLWTVSGLDASAALYRRHGFVMTEQLPSERFGPALVEQKFEWRRAAAVRS